MAANGLSAFGYVITATFLVVTVRQTSGLGRLEPWIWIVFGLATAPSIAAWTWVAVFEVDSGGSAMKTLDLERSKVVTKDGLNRIEAGAGNPKMTLICGHFKCHHGSGQDLFAGLRTPVVEQFSPDDGVEETMKEAFTELLPQEEGDGIMAANLLKEVIIKLLRRSVASNELWVERLSALQDPQIARAFAEMVSRPGASHTLDSLANLAGMSRSVFMDRFSKLSGQSPIAVLRHLRLSHAKTLLQRSPASIDSIARDVGYTNRSSFNRAFKDEFNEEPTDYLSRIRTESPKGQLPVGVS